MPLSNKWSEEKTIYDTAKVGKDFSKKIYRDTNGFEAFVVGETADCWLIEGNGLQSRVDKVATKPRIKNVASDYVLRKYIPNCYR